MVLDNHARGSRCNRSYGNCDIKNGRYAHPLTGYFVFISLIKYLITGSLGEIITTGFDFSKNVL